MEVHTFRANGRAPWARHVASKLEDDEDDMVTPARRRTRRRRAAEKECRAQLVAGGGASGTGRRSARCWQGGVDLRRGGGRGIDRRRLDFTPAVGGEMRARARGGGIFQPLAFRAWTSVAARCSRHVTFGARDAKRHAP